jgi:hypothetical protein
MCVDTQSLSALHDVRQALLEHVRLFGQDCPAGVWHMPLLHVPAPVIVDPEQLALPQLPVG